MFDLLISEEDAADIFLISESKLHSSVPDGAVSFANYDIACRLDRDSLHPGGGLLILTKKGLKYHNVQSKNVNFSCQVASLQIQDTIIALVYRRPKCTKNQDRQLVNYLGGTYGGKKVVFAGDFNLPGLKFDITPNTEAVLSEAVDKSGQSVPEMWRDLIDELQMKQLVTDPSHNLGNILDFVLCREEDESVTQEPVVDELLYQGFSDHYPVTFILNVKSIIAKERRFIYDLSKMNYELFRRLLEDFDLLRRINEANTPNEKWLILRNAIFAARKLSCPVVECKDSSQPKWSNKRIIFLKKKILRIRKKCKDENCSENIKKRRITQIKNLNCELKTCVTQARYTYENKLVDRVEDDRNYLFKHVKGIKRGGG